MIQINKEQINAFINYVFNYYNGKINICNSARLQINWLQLQNTNAGGYTRNPGIVIMNPNVILRYCNYSLSRFKKWIIIIIIHELYHVDQYIDYKRLNIDPVYDSNIEAATEIISMTYIGNHKQEIFNVFGIELSNDANSYIEYMYDYQVGAPYIRKTIKDHIFLMINELYTFEDKELQEFKDHLYNNDYVNITIDFPASNYNWENILSIDILNNELTEFGVTIEEINNAFYYNFYYGDMSYKNIDIRYPKDNKIEIVISNLKVYKIMCNTNI